MKKEKPTTKICKHCKTEINVKAKVCPQCRKKQGMGLVPKLLIAVFVFIILGSCSSSGDNADTQNNESNVEQNKDTNIESNKDSGNTKNDEPEMTMGQKNALGSAKNYLSFSAFSYEGLIEQLEFEQYSTEDATFAADNCGADWNEQAAKCAKNYLSFSSFSRGELIDQLIFEGFTQSQAEYGVTQAGY